MMDKQDMFPFMKQGIVMNLMATKNSVDGRQVQHVPIYNTGEQL
jgi:hypothetical protein